MVKVIYNDQIVYKVVTWAFLGVSLWTKKVALSQQYIINNPNGRLVYCTIKL